MPVNILREIARTVEYAASARLCGSCDRARLREGIADDRRLGRSLRGGPARERAIDLVLNVDTGLLHG